MNASDINQPTTWARRGGSTDFVRGGGDVSLGNSKPLERNVRVCEGCPDTMFIILYPFSSKDRVPVPMSCHLNEVLPYKFLEVIEYPFLSHAKPF